MTEPTDSGNTDASTSTTKQGNAFRDRIKTLLSLCPRFNNVQAEYPIGHQHVDVYYEEETSTGTTRVACECKDYADPLTRTDLENIYLKYNPLMTGTTQLVDVVRVFAPLPVNGNAQLYLGQTGYRFSTLDELELNIIDFRSYLKSLENQYRELGEVYTRPLLDDDSDAEDFITGWLSGGSHQPVAVLAGYGMGKSSLALHIAAKLAAARMAGIATRIPVLVPLSDISSQQTMEGLLGQLFTAKNRIPNYFFGLFEELNRRGRFAIILDGFDEMKHAMSLPDFKYNFNQLNRLVAPDTRVLLLGRPSAFVSDSEEHHVLRGVQKIGDRELEIPGAPEYRIIKLQQFSISQAFSFIERYVAYEGPRSSAIRGKSFDAAEAAIRIARVRENAELSALVQRPVQAKMVADLIIDGHVEWQSFSRYELFDIFIHRIIERELEKEVRRAIGLDARLDFHEKLAWWLWTKTRIGNFLGADVPKEVLGRVPENAGLDADGYRRELLSGSLLDKKLGESYHFPHRSYLEFLVARYVLTRDWNARTLADVPDALSDEIVNFLTDSGDVARLAEWTSYIDDIDGPLSHTFFLLLAGLTNTLKRPMESDTGPEVSPRKIYFHYLRLAIAQQKPNEEFNYLLKAFSSAQRLESQLMALFTLITARAGAPDEYSGPS